MVGRPAARFLALAALALAVPIPSLATDWPVVKDRNLAIVEGSALDFTQIFGTPQPIRAPVVVREDGHLAVAAPDKPRFRAFCAVTMFNGPHGGFPSHREADRLAMQWARAGYNLVRFHHVETALMEGRSKDFDFDPERLDRFHYLLAALKRLGIYWMIDAMSSWNGAYAEVGEHRFARTYHLQLDLHFDEKARAHWKRLARKLLGTRNPYTGMRIVEDPALALVTVANELGILYNARRGYPPELIARFREWRRRHDPLEADRPVPGRYARGRQAAHMNHFLAEVERETAEWMISELRALGYRGLVTAYNNGKSLQATAARTVGDVVTLHAYFDHPSDFIRPGSRMHNESAIDSRLPYVRYFALNRWLGKPFLVDEYDQPYWNEWRREAVAVPAYASLQDWDGLCRFANPVALAYDAEGPPRARSIHPFGVGLDPVARATEVIAALAYRRADVRSSSRLVAVRADPDVLLGEDAATSRPADALGYLAFVGRVGIGSDPGAAMRLPLATEPLGGVRRWFKALTADGSGDWAKTLYLLRKKGILPSANRTDAAGRVFESDTGQLRMDVGRRLLKIATPRLAALVWDGQGREIAGALEVESLTGPVLAAAASIDGEPLEKTKRILVVVAGDAVNSGAEFADGRRKLESLGRLPVQLRPVHVILRLRRTTGSAESMQAWALALDGRRRERLDVRHEDGAVMLEIDLEMLKRGPTTFFEVMVSTSNEATPGGRNG